MTRSSIITLLTDFGTNDPYTGIMKGVILSINPDTRIVDLCHHVPAQDIPTAGLFLKSAYAFFPDGTIHVAVVDPGVGSNRQPMLIETEKGFFIGPNNGLFSPILSKEKIVRVITLTSTNYFLQNIGSTFHGRDIFAPAAAHLSKGAAPDAFGPALKDPVIIDFPESKILPSGEILGEVLFADHFGNLVTSIDRVCLEKAAINRFAAEINNIRINRLLSSYAEAEDKQPFFITGSTGLLEISVQNGNAQACTGIQKGDPIRIFPV